jgi:RNA polymerase sigma factor (TIGR02999 family)
MHEITRILEAMERGDAAAAEQLLPLVYGELRRLAAHKMAHEPPGQTLQATALVHEAYLRMVGSSGPTRHRNGRGHFFAAAAESMRRILVDEARKKQRQRRGGDRQRLTLEMAQPIAAEQTPDALLALDEALERLRADDPLKAELVQLRYFAGLTIPQAAEALGISVTTANRYWAYARAWLLEEIEPETTAKCACSRSQRVSKSYNSAATCKCLWRLHSVRTAGESSRSPANRRSAGAAATAFKMSSGLRSPRSATKAKRWCGMPRRERRCRPSPITRACCRWPTARTAAASSPAAPIERCGSGMRSPARKSK